MSREFIVMGFKLCVICAVAAVSLGALNEVTEPQIIARKIQEENEALGLLVPGAEVGEKVPVDDGGVVRAYHRVDRQGSHFGYVLNLMGAGYGGEMKILAAFKLDGEIVSARLLDNQETPGLGKKAEKDSYMEMFKGAGREDAPVPTSKNMIAKGTSPGGQRAPKRMSFKTWFLGQEAGGTTDVITGATLTFLGVSKALSEGSRHVREQLGGR